MFESIKNFLHRIFVGVPAIYDCSDEVYWDDDWVYTEIYNCSYCDECYIPEIHGKRCPNCHSRISKLVEKEENNENN